MIYLNCDCYCLQKSRLFLKLNMSVVNLYFGDTFSALVCFLIIIAFICVNYYNFSFQLSVHYAFIMATFVCLFVWV